MSERFWQGRRILVTGHTGFMGGWLVQRLLGLGADVTGYALPPPTDPALFDALGLAGRIRHMEGDIRDGDALAVATRHARPEIVFHLAAQPLVRRAHAAPVETFSTNLMGTVNALEAMRRVGTVAAAVIVTTDKVYLNREWPWGYRETDTLGGHEPYGASKACAEIATEAYVRAYFEKAAPLVTTMRAGNIVGGGDWAVDRLVPDAVRAFVAGRPLTLRHPDAIRPWQHVLEPVSAMIELARGLAEGRRELVAAWNLGPRESDSKPVAWIADRLARAWGTGAAWRIEPDDGPHEARLLTLSSARAEAAFGWGCRWSAEEAIVRAAEWYRAYYDGADMATVTNAQINAYIKGDDRGERQSTRNRVTNRAVT